MHIHARSKAEQSTVAQSTVQPRPALLNSNLEQQPAAPKQARTTFLSALAALQQVRAAFSSALVALGQAWAAILSALAPLKQA